MHIASVDKELRRITRPKTVIESLRDLASQRTLLLQWTQRELRARYRQSILGVGWALAAPFFQMIVISIIFGRFLRVPTGDIPYPVFLYVAMLPWTLFAGSVAAAIPSLLTHMDLVTKTYFPREILPLSLIIARLADFALAAIILVGLFVWYRVEITSTIVWVPLLLILQIVLSIGLGLAGAAISVFVRDISFAVPLVMQLWMYATPVIYPVDMVPEPLRVLYWLNPMAGIIDGYRRTVLEGLAPRGGPLIISATICVLMGIIGYVIFKRLEMAMADVI
jgi:lipopolysaccharide transport system permease protein